MSKIDGNVAVPFKETDNYTEGKEGSGTPTTMGPAVGHVSGNPTSGGGINRSTKGFNTSVKKA